MKVKVRAEMLPVKGEGENPHCEIRWRAKDAKDAKGRDH